MTKRIAPRNYRIDWIKQHSNYQGDDCIKYPLHGGDKSWSLEYRGKQVRAARVMCIEANGEPPSDDVHAFHAAHSCGNGNIGCLNPNHLSWKTPKENQADRLIHGTDLLGNKNPMFGRKRIHSKETRAKMSVTRLIKSQQKTTNLGTNNG